MKGLEHIVDLCLTRRVSEETMTRARRPLFAMLRSDQQWHRKFSKSRVVFLAFVVFLAETVTAQTVVQRLRVGNSTEGITVALGNSGMVVTVDGWDVIAIPPGLRQPTKLFDLRGRGLISAPNAITFASGSFYFADTGSGQQLFVTDKKGNALPLLQLKFAPGTSTNVFYREGLSYDAGTNHLASMTILNDFTYRIQFIQLNGLMDREIPLNIDPSLYPVGITVHPSLGLLVSGGNKVLSVDSSGNTTPILTLGLSTTDLEGLATFPDGRLALCDLTAGHLFMYSAQLSRLTAQEQDFRLGASVRPGADTDFDPTSGGFYVLGFTATEGDLLLQVSSDGSFSRVVADMDNLSRLFVGSVNWSAFDQQIVVSDHHNIYFLDPSTGQTVLHIDESALLYNIRSALVMPDGRLLVLQNNGLAFHFLAHALGDSGYQTAVETGSVPLTLQAPTRAHLYGTRVISGNVVYDVNSGAGSTQFPASFLDGGVFPVFSIGSGPLAGKLGTADQGAITIFSVP